jgi:hypothetical protein
MLGWKTVQKQSGLASQPSTEACGARLSPLDHLPGGRILRDAVRHVSQTPNLYDKRTFAGVKPKLPWIGPTSFKKAAREVSGVQDELDL